WWLLPGGILSLWLALPLARMPFLSPIPNSVLETQSTGLSRWIWVKRVAIAAATCGMLMLTDISVRGHESSLFHLSSHHLQFVILVSCCLLLVWGFSDRPFRLWRWQNLSTSRRWELALVTAITVVASALR